MFVPAEKNAVGDRFNVHMGTADRLAAGGAVFDDFFMEAFVFAPAGDDKKLAELMRKAGDMAIA